MYVVQFEGRGWSQPMTWDETGEYITRMESLGYVYSDCAKACES